MDVKRYRGAFSARRDCQTRQALREYQGEWDINYEVRDQHQGFGSRHLRERTNLEQYACTKMSYGQN